MRELTEIQINYLLDTLFTVQRYPGSRSIGEKLLKIGHCVVAGNINIFESPIDSYIKLVGDEDFVGCVRYELDLEGFLKNGFFNNYFKAPTKRDLEEKLQKAKEVYDLAHKRKKEIMSLFIDESGED